jgi:hypothetical protein
MAFIASAAGPDGVAKAEFALLKMRAYIKDRQWANLIAQFKDEDLAAWGNLPDKTSEAASLSTRAQAALSPPFGVRMKPLATFSETVGTAWDSLFPPRRKAALSASCSLESTNRRGFISTVPPSANTRKITEESLHGAL